MTQLNLSLASMVLLLGALATANVHAASPTAAEWQIAEAGAANQYAFVVFYKQNDATTQKVLKNLGQGVAAKQGSAKVVYVNVSNAAEKALVDKHKMARAPLPMTLAIAPNGAITGVFDHRLEAKHVGEAIVTSTTATCMKSLQEGKVVLLCVHPAKDGATPQGVTEFQADADFKAKAAVVSMRLDDESEASFLKDLQIDAAKATGTTVVFMAPPGVMVGKYNANVAKTKLVTDLHAAGKCCDDPNCKHGKAK
jgi:hypothetical protein